MRKSLLVIFLVFICAVGLSAQTTNGAQEDTSQASSPVPVSREDLRKATAEMRRALRESVREADRRSVARAAAERQAVEQKQKDEAAKQKADLAAQLKHQSEEDARQRQAESQKQWATAKNYGVAGGLMLAIAVGLGVFLARRNAKTEIFGFGVVEEEPRLLLHGKSDIHTVRRAMEESPKFRALFESNGSVQIPCILEMPYKEGSRWNGAKFKCTTTLTRTGDEWNGSVRFDEMPDMPATWKNRNSRAAEIAMSRKSESAA